MKSEMNYLDEGLEKPDKKIKPRIAPMMRSPRNTF